MLYDVIIVGAGPGGMTAAIYAARRKINFVVISLDVGGQMAWSSEIDNYPGVERINGINMTNNFMKQMKKYKVKILPEEIIKIEKKGKLCYVKTKKNVYESKAVIITTGKSPRKLGVPGEEKLLGKGVHYCATCDAPLYKGKDAAVIGGGNSGLEAALYLANYCKKVYIIELQKKLMGEPHLKDRVLANKKIQVITGAKVKEIFGNKFVEGIKYDQDGSEKIVKVEGIFVEVGLITKTDFINCKKNKWKEIMIFRSTKTHEENMTSIPGIFAAGDVTDIPAKQIVAAAGEACQAALASFDYISKWDKKTRENENSE